MTKEMDGSQKSDDELSWRRFNHTALEFMGNIGIDPKDPKYWIAVTWDGAEMTGEVRRIKNTQGIEVMGVDLTRCWKSLIGKFELPNIVNTTDNKPVLILENFDEAAAQVGNIWEELSEPLNQFIETTGGTVFVAYDPIVGKKVRPAAAIRDDFRVYDQAGDGLGNIKTIEDLFDGSPSFDGCVNDPQKMKSWVEKKWFKYLKKESVSKKELVKEVVARLSMLPGTFTELEILEAFRLSLDDVQGSVGLPTEFKDYQENINNGNWGKDLSLIMEILLTNAMIGWESRNNDGGGYVVESSLRLPMEMVTAYENWNNKQDYVGEWERYFRKEAEKWENNEHPQSSAVSEGYASDGNAVKKRADFIKNQVHRYL